MKRRNEYNDLGGFSLRTRNILKRVTANLRERDLPQQSMHDSDSDAGTHLTMWKQ